MELPLTKLPRPVFERLQAIERTSGGGDGFFVSEGGKGLAIFGLIIVAIPLFIFFGMAASGEGVSPAVWGMILFLPMWILTASLDHMRRYKRGPIKPFLYINPVCFTRVTLDDVTYYNLAEELRDAPQRTDNFNDGTYASTTFRFAFDSGNEDVVVNTIAQADEFSYKLQEFRNLVLESVEQNTTRPLEKHKIFAELEDKGRGEGRPENPQQAAPPKRKNFVLAIVFSVIVGGGFFYMDTMNYQEKKLRRANSTKSIEGYLKRSFMIDFYRAQAEDKLVKAYETRLEIAAGKKADPKNKYKSKPLAKSGSANKLRELLAITEIKALPKEKSDKVIQHLQDEGSKALIGLYDEAIVKYKKTATKANPKSREAIIKVLEAARDKGWYKVELRYRGQRSKKVTNKPRMSTQRKGRKVLPMGPAFTAKDNKRREKTITLNIRNSFVKIIPQDILQFSATSKTADSMKKGAGKGKEVTSPDGPKIVFDIYYLVSPTTTEFYYTKRVGISKREDTSKPRFTGINFIWVFKISIDGKKVYSFIEKSPPAMEFTVRGTIYDSMAGTSFTKFGKLLLRRFGIPVYIQKRKYNASQDMLNRMRKKYGNKGLKNNKRIMDYLNKRKNEDKTKRDKK